MWTESAAADWVDRLPVWAEWIAVFVLLVLAYRLGALLQRLLLRDPCTESETALVGTAMTLLAFIIAFTFAMALDRYDERRDLVLAEANAIGTTYLRAQLAPEPTRSEMRAIIRRYADTRLALFQTNEDLEALNRLQAASRAELALLWDATTRAVTVIEPPSLAPSLVAAVTETIDLAEARRTTYVVRLPRAVMVALVGFAMTAAGVSGFARGGRRHFALSLFVYAMLASAIALIVDLDRPSAGAIRLVPGPLVHTRAAMTPSVPATVATPP